MIPVYWCRDGSVIFSGARYSAEEFEKLARLMPDAVFSGFEEIRDEEITNPAFDRAGYARQCEQTQRELLNK